MRDHENYASPTASLESIMTTLVIDAYKNRDIAIADVSGAYLHAEFPKEKNIILRMADIFVDIMCDVNKEYKDHIVYEVNERGKRVKIFICKGIKGFIWMPGVRFFMVSVILRDPERTGF